MVSLSRCKRDDLDDVIERKPADTGAARLLEIDIVQIDQPDFVPQPGKLTGVSSMRFAESALRRQPQQSCGALASKALDFHFLPGRKVKAKAVFSCRYRRARETA